MSWTGDPARTPVTRIPATEVLVGPQPVQPVSHPRRGRARGIAGSALPRGSGAGLAHRRRGAGAQRRAGTRAFRAQPYDDRSQFKAWDPDFIPVLGYADDAIAVALVLRTVIRQAGPDTLARHWPGTDDGLTVVRRLAGLPAAAPQE
ncbi:DUF1232 domain-containing protein [Streptomyces sp. NBS 14/10]|uniref:YkvA family protein n=1 Tax=Streptomyces sp. NBS 14/10 TaxID=1945643 RepID=UPI00211AD2C7|nr:DUF1232 domain-containing protein [Streptomyces sp. NBS 14/10]KAK1176984.1 DUF1232 domain-containing protein [Streptomyces sp. NBS 14/10]